MLRVGDMSTGFLLRTETLTRCPLCHSGTFSRLLEVPDHESHTGIYGIDVCADCGLAYTNPRPVAEALPRLYEQRTTADFAPGGAGFAGRLRHWRLDRYIHTLLGSRTILTARPRLLDFGCGDGSLALAAQRAGMDVEAVDFHTLPPATLGDTAISYRNIDTWWKGKERYDFIVLRHVLEHHPAPVKLLDQLKSRVVPHGIVAIEVPNRRSLWARTFGANYFAYYVPRHLFHFDRVSLTRVLATAGFAQLCIKPGHTPVIGRSFGYRWRRDVDNLGPAGLASFPLQVIVDTIAGESTTLHAMARINA